MIKYASICAASLLFRDGVILEHVTTIVFSVNLLILLTVDFPMDTTDCICLTLIYIVSCYFIQSLDVAVDNFLKPLVQRTNNLFASTINKSIEMLSSMWQRRSIRFRHK